jgi:hypothetical protein
LNIEDKIQIFQNNLDKYFEIDKYNYPEDDICDYFFLDYQKNDFRYNKVQFSFLETLESEKEIIKLIDGLIHQIIKYDHEDSIENIIGNYISCGFTQLFLHSHSDQ